MKRLRELREAAGLTMKALGQKIGVAESTISLYETGKREPDYATLKALVDIFGVSADYLLGFTDVPTVNGKGPYPVSISPTKDKRSYKITTPEPISFLFVLYNLDVETFSAIAGIDRTLANRLCIPFFKLPDTSMSYTTPQPAYSSLTPEQHKRIINFFNLGRIEKLDENTEISLRPDPVVCRKLHATAFRSMEDEEMLNSFHRLDPEDQGQVKGFIKGLESGEKYEKADTPSGERTG